MVKRHLVALLMHNYAQKLHQRLLLSLLNNYHAMQRQEACLNSLVSKGPHSLGHANHDTHYKTYISLQGEGRGRSDDASNLCTAESTGGSCQLSQIDAPAQHPRRLHGARVDLKNLLSSLFIREINFYLDFKPVSIVCEK